MLMMFFSVEKEEDEEAEAQKEKDEGKVWMYACICGRKKWTK